MRDLETLSLGRVFLCIKSDKGCCITVVFIFQVVFFESTAKDSWLGYVEASAVQ